MALYTRVDNADGSVVRMGVDESMEDITTNMGAEVGINTALLNRIAALELRVAALEGTTTGDPSIDLDPYTPQE